LFFFWSIDKKNEYVTIIMVSFVKMDNFNLGKIFFLTVLRTFPVDPYYRRSKWQN